MIAHVGVMPVEELLAALCGTAGAWAGAHLFAARLAAPLGRRSRR